jgi:hypothetical protein
VGFGFDFKRILIEKAKGLHFLGDWVLALLREGHTFFRKAHKIFTKYSKNLMEA